MRADPVSETLRPSGFGESLVGSTQCGDEDLSFSDLAGRGVDDANRLPAIIDEEFFTGAVNLAHRKSLCLTPLGIENRELRIALTRRVRGAVFIPQQLTSDAFTRCSSHSRYLLPANATRR